MKVFLLTIGIFLIGAAGVLCEDSGLHLSAEVGLSLGYLNRNSEFINDESISSHQDFDSTLAATVSMQGSEFLVGSFYTDLILSTRLTKDALPKVSFSSLYFKSMLYDHIFLTAGKTNLGDLSRINSTGPSAVVALDLILGLPIHVVIAAYANNVENWEDISLAAEVGFDNSLMSITEGFYYEAFENFVNSGTANIIWKFLNIGFTYDLKLRTDNVYYRQNPDETFYSEPKEDGVYYRVSGSAGVSIETFSASVSYSRNNEGYTAEEHDRYKEATLADPSAISNYDELLYDRSYLSIGLSVTDFLIRGLLVSTGLDVSLDRVGFLLKGNARYRFSERLYLTCDVAWAYSDDDSPYVLFSKANPTAAAIFSFFM